MSKGEKVQLLKKQSDFNPEARSLLEIAQLYYPKLLDSPEEATASMIRGYNRLVAVNISDANLKNRLIMFEEE